MCKSKFFTNFTTHQKTENRKQKTENMETKPLNEKESLELITRMIKNTQRRLERGAGMPMLIWGYASIVSTLCVWLAVTQTSNSAYNLLWLMIPAIGLVGMFLTKRKQEEVKTYPDKVIGHIWLVVGCVGGLLSFLSGFAYAIGSVGIPILFIIIVLMSMGTVLTGLVAKYKAMIIGGIVGILVALVHHLLKDYNLQMLTFALAFLSMHIIPGHILNHKAKHKTHV